MARLTSRFWVDAYLARLRLSDIPAFVVAHGDDTAGDVLVRLNLLDGTSSLFQRRYDLLADSRAWECLSQGPDREIDDSLTRSRARDPDMWIIEVEDRHGRHMLDAPGLG
ncbi:MAG: DUF1491 family protein [Roseobacter sp.]